MQPKSQPNMFTDRYQLIQLKDLQMQCLHLLNVYSFEPNNQSGAELGFFRENNSQSQAENKFREMNSEKLEIGESPN